MKGKGSIKGIDSMKATDSMKTTESVSSVQKTAIPKLAIPRGGTSVSPLKLNTQPKEVSKSDQPSNGGGIPKYQSAPSIISPRIAKQRSASLISKQYTTEQVIVSPRDHPTSPRRKSGKFFVRNLEGQIAKISTKDRSPIDKTIDPYDTKIVNELLNGERDDYDIVWVDGIDFFV